MTAALFFCLSTEPRCRMFIVLDNKHQPEWTSSSSLPVFHRCRVSKLDDGFDGLISSATTSHQRHREELTVPSFISEMAFFSSATGYTLLIFSTGNFPCLWSSMS